MQFRLTYAGNLLAHKRGRGSHIHDIRQAIHEQLSFLSTEHPSLITGHPGGEFMPYPGSIWGSAGAGKSYNWRPLVTRASSLICALDILMLRNGPPGKVKTDLDNRLKTLFDALRMPNNAEEIGLKNYQGQQLPKPMQDPFYVLLEDDSLITRVAVTSDMLLEPVQGVSRVEDAVRLVINVTVWPYKVTIGNVKFSGT